MLEENFAAVGGSYLIGADGKPVLVEGSRTEAKKNEQSTDEVKTPAPVAVPVAQPAKASNKSDKE